MEHKKTCHCFDRQDIHAKYTDRFISKEIERRIDSISVYIFSLSQARYSEINEDNLRLVEYLKNDFRRKY